jgi:16S rRNA (cytidine1402-2'-O)-methyltransferase
VGPSAILLSLMASGMNGQCFQFNGYLPIESSERKNSLKEMEAYSRKKNCTQIFIETPYRNNQLLLDILAVCHTNTLLCIAAELTSSAEKIITQKISEWKKNIPALHKKPAIFLPLAAGLDTKN